ncbi:tyrosine-protein phosphatase [Streptomyces cavernicola]|uniref:Tyrosine-protein phosphatase n=1 Tax=Streptomyces cavernicola TaxID=3043613 RepID=A0ABT6SKP9_9ACTN|nr:tyrosine-protein phosphatase [Streptomyces sp. B-S-A6]MDI3408767.1 tyrosine-protein phosphatase [Streptomyces sp. B-S-A6]
MRTTRIRRTTAAGLVSAALLGALTSCSSAEAPKSADAPAKPVSHSRTSNGGLVELEGAVNVRDLGGIRTAHGGQLRAGQVFRADSLGKLTDADVRKVGDLDLRTVVDYRVPFEVERDGADRLPKGVEVTARPVNDNGLYAKTMEAIGSKDPVKQQEMLGDGKAEQMMEDIYSSFVTSAETRAQFAATLRDLAQSGKAPLLFHCTSGKDRTGWTSYVLLRAVGVSEETAEKDYLKSNEYRAEADRKTREGLKAGGYMENPDLLIPLQEVREDYLDAALDQVEREHGSFGRYLTEGLGLDRSTLLKLRARLVR